MIETQRNHYLKSVEVAQESLVNYSTERLIAEHKEHHKKANEYHDRLVDKIIEEHGQNTLNELYRQVVDYEKKLSGRSIFASGVQEQFSSCAEEVKESYDKDKAMYVFICFLEETFENIIDWFFDAPNFAQILKDYNAGLIETYRHLDDESQQLMGELYPEYLSDMVEN